MSTLNLTRVVSEGARSRTNGSPRREPSAEPRAAQRVTQVAIMQSADADCLLYAWRRATKPAYELAPSFSALPEPKRRLGAWVAGRRLGQHPPKLYWSVPAAQPSVQPRPRTEKDDRRRTIR